MGLDLTSSLRALASSKLEDQEGGTKWSCVDELNVRVLVAPNDVLNAVMPLWDAILGCEGPSVNKIVLCSLPYQLNSYRSTTMATTTMVTSLLSCTTDT